MNFEGPTGEVRKSVLNSDINKKKEIKALMTFTFKTKVPFGRIVLLIFFKCYLSIKNVGKSITFTVLSTGEKQTIFYILFSNILTIPFRKVLNTRVRRTRIVGSKQHVIVECCTHTEKFQSKLLEREISYF